VSEKRSRWRWLAYAAAYLMFFVVLALIVNATFGLP
jgi:hypothetical protein